MINKKINFKGKHTPDHGQYLCHADSHIFWKAVLLLLSLYSFCYLWSKYLSHLGKFPVNYNHSEIWTVLRPLYGYSFPTPINQVELNFDLCGFCYAKQVGLALELHKAAPGNAITCISGLGNPRNCKITAWKEYDNCKKPVKYQKSHLGIRNMKPTVSLKDFNNVAQQQSFA